VEGAYMTELSYAKGKMNEIVLAEETALEIARRLSPEIRKVFREVLREELTTGNKTKTKPAKPQSLASVFDTSIAADTDILAKDITIEYDGAIRVVCAFDTAGILRAKLMRNGVTKILDYNVGATLTANALYAFDLPVKKGDLFNLRYSVAAIAHYIEVQFILFPI